MLFRRCLCLILAGFALAGSLIGHAEPAVAKPLLTLTLEPTKRIYSSREGVSVKFVFHASQRVKLCLDEDILSQVQVAIARSGQGEMPLQPLVMRDNSELFERPRKIRWLDSGESLTLRANLKRFHFSQGYRWQPGEYSASVTFGLCEQTPGDYDDPAGKETPIQSDGPGWFMIMS